MSKEKSLLFSTGNNVGIAAWYGIYYTAIAAL